MKNNIQKAIEQNIEEFINIRHQLHQNPEIGFEEKITSDLVAKKLQEWGYEVHRGLAKTGVVGTLRVGNGKKRLGLRADMDALPMTETGNPLWKSQVANRFHGCGHDGHTTILLAAAKYLAETKNFDGTLHLIFQPAEELLYGGKVMVEDGLFDLFPCDMIYGLHNMPPYAEGEFYFKEGVFMASSDTIHIEVNGKGAHGAMPEASIDAAVIASYIVTALQTIISRNIDPAQRAVITVGSIQSGEAPNIINEKALLKLSVRALCETTRQLILERITTLATAQAESFGATVKIDHINGCPALINDPAATQYGIELARELFGNDKVHTDTMPLMGSEDFAFLLNEIPHGAYCFVGTAKEITEPKVHNPNYDFNDHLIAPCATFWCALTEKYLK